ncbi:hypothetical protein BJY01DRAFT_248922 [Aspergillus pseudoustus]|uniref:Uncharacterized protein n=1 Tax=Aspergillus pseudoustus TaxID=1810923 RepID=A0ABR4JRV7_9EURO
MSGLLLTVHDWQIFLQELETSLDSGIWRFREQEVPFWAWHEEFARLRIWADNIGLYKARKPSPDEVLSELPLVKSQITRELARIRRLIRDIEEEVLTYEYGDSTATESYTDSESDDDEEEESITVFQDIYCHLKDSIDGLNRMSTIVSQRARSATEGLKSAGTEKKVSGVDVPVGETTNLD